MNALRLQRAFSRARGVVVRTLQSPMPMVQHRQFCAKPVKLAMKDVKNLREISGAPIMECKQALTDVLAENEGLSASSPEAIEKAINALRLKGVKTAAKKSGRAAKEGLVAMCVDSGLTGAAVVEVNSETDFVARNEKFQGSVADISGATFAISQDPSVGQVDLSDINAAPLPDGATVADSVTDLITSIRENIKVRRGSSIHAPEGVVGAYMHGSVGPAFPSTVAVDGETRDVTMQLGRIGSLVAIKAPNTTATQEEMKKLGSNLAMHVVAAKPSYLTRDQVPESTVEAEKAIVVKQAEEKGQNMKFLDRMVEGRMNKFYEEHVLTEQVYMGPLGDNSGKGKAPKVTDFLQSVAGDDATLTDFVSFSCGEPLVGEEEDSEESDF